jgi:hypothetical protein
MALKMGGRLAAGLVVAKALGTFGLGFGNGGWPAVVEDVEEQLEVELAEEHEEERWRVWWGAFLAAALVVVVVSGALCLCRSCRVLCVAKRELLSCWLM